MTIEVGGNGGNGFIMPQMAITAAALGLKTSTGAEFVSSEAGFFTSGIDISHTEEGYESVSSTGAENTNEQDIIPLFNGAGLLTHAMASVMSSAASTMIIRVYIDGNSAIVFTSESISTTRRFCIGNFLMGRLASVLSSNPPVLGSNADAGYNATPGAIMTTPTQTITEFSIGIPYKTSLRVTQQSSSNITGTAELNKAAACHTTSIPEGL